MPISEDLLRERLNGIDEALEPELRNWNVAGFGVGIVVGDELRYAKGFGFRDYGNKLPFTAETLIPIASNTKLMTATACGMLVEEGKLTWDEPVRRSVPQIEFSSDHLNANVSLRDMLAHRTGITRHDRIWYKSSFTRAELFDRLRLLQPMAPIRTQHIYNNLMYAAAGYLIELQTGKTWEQFVREWILTPLGMKRSCLSIAEMTADSDHGVPYSERRDGTELYRIPSYEQISAAAPAGACISCLSEISHWMAAQLNEGKYQGETLIPPSILAATLQPAMANPNVMAETKGYWEVLNPFVGMGRNTAVYRGNLITFHGGYLDGFHTQVSFLPREKVGVAAFVIGDHAGALPHVLVYNLFERLLGLDQTPWGERFLKERLSAKEAATKKRQEAAARTKPAIGASPAHPVEQYAGEYESPAYGVMRITAEDTTGELRFDFNAFRTPLEHVHFERFDTPDDEEYGKFSLNFFTNSQGDVEKLFTTMDEAEVVFTKRPSGPPAEVARSLAGGYKVPDGTVAEVAYRANGDLVLTRLTQAGIKLLPYRGLTFKSSASPDTTFTFVLEGDSAVAMEMTDATGTLRFPRV